MKLYRRIFDKLFVNYGRICKSVSLQTDNKIKPLESKIMNLDVNVFKLKNNMDVFNYFNPELLLLKYSDKKKILLVGFYGAPNLGDELMLDTLLQYFATTDIEITIMLADNPDYDIGFYPAVKIIHYPKTLYDFNILAQHYDTLIFGGGAIIDDNWFASQDSYKWDLGTILIKLSERFLVWGKSVFAIGLSSISEFKNAEYITKLIQLIEQAEYFSLRDTNSYHSLLSCCHLKDNRKLRIISDIAIANKDIIVNNKLDRKVKDIGIIWIPCEDNIDKLKRTLIALKDKYIIHLIPFYGYVNFDTVHYQQVIDEVAIDNIILEKLAINMKELVGIFNKCDMLIAMRYHAVLIGNILNIPTLSICYDKHPHYINKMDYLSKIFNDSNMLYFSKMRPENIEKHIKTTIKQHLESNVDLKGMVKKSRKEISNIIDKIVN